MPIQRSVHITESEWSLFLEQVARVQALTVAAKMAGISHAVVKARMEREPAFAEAVADAQLLGQDAIKAEAITRATTGYTELVLHQGKPVIDPREPYREGPDGERYPVYLTQRKVSDALLARILSTYHPEFRDSSRVAVGADDNKPPLTLEQKRERAVAFLQARGIINEGQATEQFDDLG